MTKHHLFYALFAASLASSFFLGATGAVLAALVAVVMVSDQLIAAFERKHTFDKQAHSIDHVHAELLKLSSSVSAHQDASSKQLTELAGQVNRLVTRGNGFAK